MSRTDRTPVWSNGLMTPDLAHDERLDPRLRRILALRPFAAAARRGGPRRAPGGGEHPRGRPGPRRLPGVPGSVRYRGGRSLGRPVGHHDAVHLGTRRQHGEAAGHPARVRSALCRASITSMAAAWPPCPASTGCTGAGASTLRPTASWSSWWISATASRPPRRRRSHPSPPGLNDCVSGLRWVAAHAADFGIDPTRIVVAGESGGGNLTLATGLKLKREGDLGLDQGPLRPVPVHRRPVAGTRLPFLGGERGHPAAPPQQSRAP